MNLGLLVPELVAIGFLIAMLLGELFIDSFSKKHSARLATAGCFALLGTLLLRSTNGGYAFGEVFVVNAFTTFFKVFFVLAMLPIIKMSSEYFQAKLRHPGEFFLIIWSTLIGLMFLASSNDFLLLFISLEIVTLSFYITSAYMKNNLLSIEAGLKYLIIGSLASAFLIYGISLAYIACGSTTLSSVALYYLNQPHTPLMTLSILLIIAGVGFKVGAVPFQLWIADVYEGAPAPVVGFLSVGSKAAGVLIGLKLLFDVFGSFEIERQLLFSVLAAMTIIYGNLGALPQKNIKRLFAYSSISHAGYILIGIAAGTISGVAAVLFYLIAFGVSNLAAFLVISIVSSKLGSDRIEDYRGLFKRSPLLGAAMFIALLSLAGIPPLAGFFGKFLVLLAAMQQGLTWVALLGLLAVAVSLYYYLNLIKKMYVDENINEKAITFSEGSRGYLIILMIAIIFIGVVQAPFYTFATNAAASLF
jgi:NADH-quinone oxidoreductase subunit N